MGLNKIFTGMEDGAEYIDGNFTILDLSKLGTEGLDTRVLYPFTQKDLISSMNTTYYASGGISIVRLGPVCCLNSTFKAKAAIPTATNLCTLDSIYQPVVTAWGQSGGLYVATEGSTVAIYSYGAIAANANVTQTITYVAAN